MILLLSEGFKIDLKGQRRGNSEIDEIYWSIHKADMSRG